MFQLRENIHDLEMDPFVHRESIIKADANEAYYTLLPKSFSFSGNDFNHYPDSEALKLRGFLGDYYGLDKENILLSNGSSQVLEMIFWSYCEPSDKVLTFEPGFSMFGNYIAKAAGNLIWIPTENFVQDLNTMALEVEKEKPKVILICNPNNPTGYVNTREELLAFVQRFPEYLCIIDEAYSDFCDESVVGDVNNYPNLLVIKTLSKAMGLAGLRLGFIAGNQSLIEEFNKARLPYNVGASALRIGEKIFPEGIKKLDFYITEVKETLKYYKERLEKMGYKTYPTGTNFILAKPPIPGIKDQLEKEGIFIRQFIIDGETYHRITAVSPEQREALMDRMEEVICELQNIKEIPQKQK